MSPAQCSRLHLDHKRTTNPEKPRKVQIAAPHTPTKHKREEDEDEEDGVVSQIKKLKSEIGDILKEAA